MNDAAKTCDWREDEDDGNWWTTCQQTFEFFDGTPEDNSFRFCPYCGLPLISVPRTNEDES